MKIIINLCFIFINVFCFSQQKNENEFVIYETNEYFIKYQSENLNLNVISEKCEGLFCNIFELTNKKNTEKPFIPLIQLKINDCSMLGIGTYTFEKQIKKKDSNYTKIIRFDNYEFYEKREKIDEFMLVSYVCIKNHKVYTLECLTKMKDSNENNEEELIIMNTFRVK